MHIGLRVMYVGLIIVM